MRDFKHRAYESKNNVQIIHIFYFSVRVEQERKSKRKGIHIELRRKENDFKKL